jgi:hypothetical protein
VPRVVSTRVGSVSGLPLGGTHTVQVSYKETKRCPNTAVESGLQKKPTPLGVGSASRMLLVAELFSSVTESIKPANFLKLNSPELVVDDVDKN